MFWSVFFMLSFRVPLEVLVLMDLQDHQVLLGHLGHLDQAVDQVFQDLKVHLGLLDNKEIPDL